MYTKSEALSGALTVLCGPMFSGKTELLIQRVLAATVKAVVYKPVADTRYADMFVHSHNGLRIAAVGLELDAPNLLDDTDVGVIAIDEAQFLLSDAVPRILEAVRAGVHCIVAGLDLDSFGRPFGPIPILMSFATDVVKLSGKCARCTRASTRSQRLVQDTSPIWVGGAEAYEPRCLQCFDSRGIVQ